MTSTTSCLRYLIYLTTFTLTWPSWFGLQKKTLSPLWLNQKLPLSIPSKLLENTNKHACYWYLMLLFISLFFLYFSSSTNLTFSEFLALFENDDDYEQLMVTLFEQHDFILKTNAMWHVAKLIRHFQDKIDEQRDYIWSIFVEMEWAGLHELLNLDYKQTGGTSCWQWWVCFTLTTCSSSPSPILRLPTPYPWSTSSSSSPHPVALHYSPTASQYLIKSSRRS